MLVAVRTRMLARCRHEYTFQSLSFQSDVRARVAGFGPFVPNIVQVEYNSTASLELAFEVRAHPLTPTFSSFSPTS